MKRVAQISVIVAVIALAVTLAFTQTQSKRLILKDGTFQAATKWEMKGDRVRYFSAERFNWEEIPNSLVDWPATEKYQKDVAEGKIVSGDNEKDEPDPGLDAPEPEPPTVAPGLKLPDGNGIFLMERFQDQPVLVEIAQNGSEINEQRSRNILRAVILPLPSGPSQSVELKGLRSPVQSHSTIPEIFINIASDLDAKRQPEKPASDRFRIVRLQRKNDVRVVGSLKISLRGNIKEQQEFVPSKLESLSGDWLKLVPVDPLPTGEYAVVEIVEGGQMNLYVWDFGVDPKAPANVSAIKPAIPKEREPGKSEIPVLNKRKK